MNISLIIALRHQLEKDLVFLSSLASLTNCSFGSILQCLAEKIPVNLFVGAHSIALFIFSVPKFQKCVLHMLILINRQLSLHSFAGLSANALAKNNHERITTLLFVWYRDWVALSIFKSLQALSGFWR